MFILMKNIWMRAILEEQEKREFFTTSIIPSIRKISKGQPMIMSVSSKRYGITANIERCDFTIHNRYKFQLVGKVNASENPGRLLFSEKRAIMPPRHAGQLGNGAAVPSFSGRRRRRDTPRHRAGWRPRPAVPSCADQSGRSGCRPSHTGSPPPKRSARATSPGRR